MMDRDLKLAEMSIVDAATAHDGHCALADNMLAVATAEALQQGRTVRELEELCKFLQLLQTALKAYM